VERGLGKPVLIEENAQLCGEVRHGLCV
jgi:hypothetical protein